MNTRKKVMLVDDDHAVLDYLQARLATAYEVVSTQDPHAAVALALAQSPDVILCDIDMPAMSGGEVAAALAADPFTRRIPVIYLTALVSPQETRELDGLVGGKPGVSKRARLVELVERIEEVAASQAA